MSHTSPNLVQVLRTVDLLLCELASLNEQGPAITLVHRYRVRVHGSACQAGEEVARVLLTHRGRQAVVLLGLAPMLVTDFFARHLHVPLSATEIASRMRRMDFYQRHGLNLGTIRTRKISQSSVKEYVRRIRFGLSHAFERVCLHIDPKAVLVSEEVGKEVLYSLHASVRWLHVNELDERLPRVRRTA